MTYSTMIVLIHIFPSCHRPQHLTKEFSDHQLYDNDNDFYFTLATNSSLTGKYRTVVE